MTKIEIKGGIPLSGTVKTAGAKNSILKLIHAAMFSNEDVVLENVPRIKNVEVDLEIIEALGGTYEWLAGEKLRLNGSGISSYEIPQELGAKYRTAALLAAPLVYRFGKAVVPLPGGCKIGSRPINRWIETWQLLGYNVKEAEKFVYLEAKTISGGNINFKVNTHMGTDNAILSALCGRDETIIKNAAQEPEVDDLIKFCNLLGGEVVREEPGVIRVTGKNVFTGGTFKVMPDRNEVVTYAVAALVTGGNINIQGVNKSDLLAFTSVLTNMGAKFEFSGDEMRVWHTSEFFKPTNITTAPAPGFMTDWQPLITLLLTQADGESLVHETVYTDRFGYVRELNGLGAKINIVKPSEVGLEMAVSEDSYDVKTMGEPSTVAQIHGPTKLRAGRMQIPDLRAGATLVLAGLAAEGKSELFGYEHVDRGYENFVGKLTDLGAHITILD